MYLWWLRLCFKIPQVTFESSETTPPARASVSHEWMRRNGADHKVSIFEQTSKSTNRDILLGTRDTWVVCTKLKTTPAPGLTAESRLQTITPSRIMCEFISISRYVLEGRNCAILSFACLFGWLVFGVALQVQVARMRVRLWATLHRHNAHSRVSL